MDITSLKVISDGDAQIVSGLDGVGDVALVRWAGPDRIYWGTPSGKIFQYDLISGTVKHVSDYQGLFAVSPDNRYLATDCQYVEARGIYVSIRTCITNLSTEQTSLIMPNNEAASRPFFNPFRWHSSGSWLITSLGGQTEPIYEISVGNVDGTVQRQITQCVFILCADWLPDPALEATITHQNGSVLGQPYQTFLGHIDNVNSVAWSPDGRQIASGSTDGTVRLWDVKTGQTGRIFGNLGKSSVDRVSWSADGTDVMVWRDASPATMEVWDIATGIMTIVDNPGFDPLQVSPDGEIRLVVNKDGTIDLYGASNGQLQNTLHADGVLAWSHDSHWLFTWRTTYVPTPDKSNVFMIKKIQVWATRNGTMVRELVQPAFASIDLGSGSVSPDSQLLAVTTFEDTTVWNISTGHIVMHVEQGGIISPLLGSTQVDWSPDSRKLALAASYSVQVWNISIPLDYF